MTENSERILMHAPLTHLPLTIPKISDALLEELTRKIRPVVECSDELFFIEPVDPRREAFTWDPTFVDLACGLKEVAKIRTLHAFGASAFFKPSLAEVFAQLPAGYIDSITAFKVEVIEEAPEDETDKKAWKAAMYWGFHLATTTLYEAE